MKQPEYDEEGNAKKIYNDNESVVKKACAQCTKDTCLEVFREDISKRLNAGFDVITHHILPNGIHVYSYITYYSNSSDKNICDININFGEKNPYTDKNKAYNQEIKSIFVTHEIEQKNIQNALDNGKYELMLENQDAALVYKEDIMTDVISYCLGGIKSSSQYLSDNDGNPMYRIVGKSNFAIKMKRRDGYEYNIQSPLGEDKTSQLIKGKNETSEVVHALVQNSDFYDEEKTEVIKAFDELYAVLNNDRTPTQDIEEKKSEASKGLGDIERLEGSVAALEERLAGVREQLNNGEPEMLKKEIETEELH